MGKSSINEGCSISTFDYRRVVEAYRLHTPPEKLRNGGKRTPVTKQLGFVGDAWSLLRAG